MFQRKQRRFRRRSGGRNNHQHSNGVQARLRSNTFSNGHNKNNYRPTLSAEKLFEKYSALAKEAMSSGDKTLSENYFQHADHFMRIIEDKNRNRNQDKDNLVDKPAADVNKTSEDNNNNQDQPTKNNNSEKT